MDDALRAEWYDLADEDREPFLEWLHGVRLPYHQKRPGILWAGHYEIAKRTKSEYQDGLAKMHTDDPRVATGSEYVLLLAASSPDVFFDPHRQREEDPEDRAGLAKRRQHRSALFIVEARVNGPEYRSLMPGTGPAPAMQLGAFNVLTPEDEFDLGRYYRQVRYAEIPRTRGCIGMKKLVSVAGWPKQGVLYEFVSMEAGEEDFEPRFRAASLPGTRKGRSLRESVVHGPNAPHAGRRIWPAV